MFNTTQMSRKTRGRLFDAIAAGQHFQADGATKAEGLRAHAIIHAFCRDTADHESGVAGAADCLAVVARQMRGE